MAAHISISKQLHYATEGEMGGIDVREPSTAVFAASSIDRYSGPATNPSEFVQSQVNPVFPLGIAKPTSPYDFQINSNQNLLAGFFTRIAVSEVSFRWTIPTITSRNSQIYIIWGPGGRTAITNVVGNGGGGLSFTMASTTGYSGGQTIQVGGLSAVSTSAGVLNLNGNYTITTTSGTTLVCNNPTGLPAFTTVAVTGTVGIVYLVSVAEGWYDLQNNTITGSNSQGNLAFQLQSAVRTATSSSTFIMVYNNDPVVSTLVPVATPQPYGAFTSLSGNTDTYYWQRWTDPSAPNRVGLFEMMSFKTVQQFRSSQLNSPNASLLSSPFVDITCDQLTYNQALKDADTGTSHNILCRIYLVPDAFTGSQTTQSVANLGSSPLLIHRAFPFPKQIRWRGDQNFGNLRFQVWDSQGYLLTTADGVTGTTDTSFYDSDMGDWTMTMLVSEV